MPIALHFEIDIKEIEHIVYVGGVPDRVPVDLAQALTKILRRVISIVSAFNCFGWIFQRVYFSNAQNKIMIAYTEGYYCLLDGLFVTIKSVSVALSFVTLVRESIRRKKFRRRKMPFNAFKSVPCVGTLRS